MKKEEVEVENIKEEKVGVMAAKNCVKNKGRTKEDTKNEAKADMKRLEGKESRRDPELDRKSMGEGGEALINENETSVMVRGDEKNKQGHNLKEDQVKRKSKSEYDQCIDAASKKTFKSQKKNSPSKNADTSLKVERSMTLVKKRAKIAKYPDTELPERIMTKLKKTKEEELKEKNDAKDRESKLESEEKIDNALPSPKETKTTPIPCRVCDKFISKGNMSKHIRQVHSKTDVKDPAATKLPLQIEIKEDISTASCAVCGKGFVNKSTMRKHKRRAHPFSDAEDDESKEEKKGNIAGVIITRGKQADIRAGSQRVESENKTIATKRFECPDCDKGFNVESNMWNHRKFYCERKQSEPKTSDKKTKTSTSTVTSEKRQGISKISDENHKSKKSRKECNISAPTKEYDDNFLEDLECEWCHKEYTTTKILKKHKAKSCPENPNRKTTDCKELPETNKRYEMRTRKSISRNEDGEKVEATKNGQAQDLDKRKTRTMKLIEMRSNARDGKVDKEGILESEDDVGSNEGRSFEDSVSKRAELDNEQDNTCDEAEEDADIDEEEFQEFLSMQEEELSDDEGEAAEATVANTGEVEVEEDSNVDEQELADKNEAGEPENYIDKLTIGEEPESSGVSIDDNEEEETEDRRTANCRLNNDEKVPGEKKEEDKEKEVEALEEDYLKNQDDDFCDDDDIVDDFGDPVEEVGNDHTDEQDSVKKMEKVSQCLSDKVVKLDADVIEEEVEDVDLLEMDEEVVEDFDVEVGEDLDVDSLEVVVDVDEQQRSQEEEEKEEEADEDVTDEEASEDEEEGKGSERDEDEGTKGDKNDNGEGGNKTEGGSQQSEEDEAAYDYEEEGAETSDDEEDGEEGGKSDDGEEENKPAELNQQLEENHEEEEEEEGVADEEQTDWEEGVEKEEDGCVDSTVEGKKEGEEHLPEEMDCKIIDEEQENQPDELDEEEHNEGDRDEEEHGEEEQDMEVQGKISLEQNEDESIDFEKELGTEYLSYDVVEGKNLGVDSTKSSVDIMELDIDEYDDDLMEMDSAEEDEEDGSDEEIQVFEVKEGSNKDADGDVEAGDCDEDGEEVPDKIKFDGPIETEPGDHSKVGNEDNAPNMKNEGNDKNDWDSNASDQIAPGGDLGDKYENVPELEELDKLLDKYKHSVPAPIQGHLYSATSIEGDQFSATSIEGHLYSATFIDGDQFPATSIEGDQFLGTLEHFPDSQYLRALAKEEEEYLETSNEPTRNFGSPPLLDQDDDTLSLEAAELEDEVSLEEQVSEKISAQAHNGCFFDTFVGIF